MRLDTRGAVALILATGVAVALVVTSLGAAFHRGPISQEETTLLSTVLGAAVGSVGTYLGITRARSLQERPGALRGPTTRPNALAPPTGAERGVYGPEPPDQPERR